MPPFSLPTSLNPMFALQDIEPLVGNESEVSGSISQNSQEMQDRARRGKSKRKAPDGSERPSSHLSKRKIADDPKTRRVFLAPFEKDIFCFNSSTMDDKFFLDDPGQASFVPMEAGAMEYQGLLSDVSDEYQGLLSEESDKDKKRLFAVGGSFHRISEFHKMQSEKLEQDHLIGTEKIPNKYWDEIRDIDQEEENVKKSKEQNDRYKKEISEHRRITLDEYDQMESKILSDYDLKINPLKKNINDINERLNGDKKEKEICFIHREKEVRADIENANKKHTILGKKIRSDSFLFRAEFESQFADQLKIQLKELDDEFENKQKELDDEFENKQKELEDKFEKNIPIVRVPSQPHRPFALPPRPVIKECRLPKPYIKGQKQLILDQIMAKLKSIVTDPVFVEFFEKKDVYKTVSSSISASGGERREGINFEDFTDPELQDFARQFLGTQEDKIIKSFVRILKEGKDAINHFLGQEDGPFMLKDFFLKVVNEHNSKSNFKIKDKKISFFKILGFFIDSDFSFKDLNTKNLTKLAIFHKSLKFMNKIIVSDPDFFKNHSNVIEHIFESARKGSPTVFSSLFFATGDCFDINEQDREGKTVLNSIRYAAEPDTHRSKKSMICYLLLLGADPLIADYKGELPIDKVPAWESDVKKLFEEYEKCKSSQSKVVAGGGVGGDGDRGEGGVGGEDFPQESMETIRKKQLDKDKDAIQGLLSLGGVEVDREVGVGGDGDRGEGGVGGEDFPQESMETIRKKQLDKDKDAIKKKLEREKARLEQQKIYKREKLVSEQEAKRPQELEKYVKDKIRLELQQINQEKARKLEQIEAVKNQIESDKAIFLQQIHEREINELQPIQEEFTRQERQKDDALSHMESKKSEVLRNIVLEEDKLKAEDEKIKKSEIDLQKRRKQAIENYKKATEETKAKLNSDKETLDGLFVSGWQPMPYQAIGRSQS